MSGLRGRWQLTGRAELDLGVLWRSDTWGPVTEGYAEAAVALVGMTDAAKTCQESEGFWFSSQSVVSE